MPGESSLYHYIYNFTVWQSAYTSTLLSFPFPTIALEIAGCQLVVVAKQMIVSMSSFS